jgi:hypothetical protein
MGRIQFVLQWVVAVFIGCLLASVFSYAHAANTTLDGASSDGSVALRKLVQDYGFTIGIKGKNILFDLTSNDRLMLMNGVEYSVSVAPEYNVTSVFVTTNQTKTLLDDKNLDGIYEGTFVYNLPSGEYTFSVSFLDVSGVYYNVDVPASINPSSQLIIKKDEEGTYPVSRAKVTIYSFNFPLNEWNEWNARDFFQSNPLETDSDGSFSLMVPPGKYYIMASGEKIHDFKSPIFTINSLSIITKTFEAEPRYGMNFEAADYILYILIILLAILLWYVYRLIRELRRLRKKIGHHSDVELDYLRHMEIYMAEESSRQKNTYKSLFD